MSDLRYNNNNSSLIRVDKIRSQNLSDQHYCITVLIVSVTYGKYGIHSAETFEMKAKDLL